MIKLFEFQEKEIRTVQENGKTWFSGQDVFFVLGLTWRGSGGLKNRQLSENQMIAREYQTLGGKQSLIFITEQALYKIAFRTQSSEVADKFTDWVSELLVKLRSGELLLKQNVDFKSHFLQCLF